MLKVRDVISRCDTGLIQGLNFQLIATLNTLVPNLLVSIADLNVDVKGSAINPFVQPAARTSLNLAIRRRGKTLVVNSAYRTVAQQYLLRKQFEQGLCGIRAAAQPGFSNHESGLALDVEDPDGWEPFLERHNWIRLGRDFDPPHFDYIYYAATRSDVGTLGVRAFQRLWNRYNPRDRLSEDGDFGPQTEARLANAPANGFSPPFNRVLRLQEPRMQGDDVARVQQALIQSPLISTTIKVTGIFDQATERTVRQFQEATGKLAVDGVVGQTTLRALGLI